MQPTAGCSKTSDVLTLSKKRPRSSSGFEPQPGCSKSLDFVANDSEKPCLVIKEKRPYDADTDPFANFVSACLQADRSKDMEKIIKKLRHHYEKINREYAGSQTFADLLNSHRDRIQKKGRVFFHVQTVIMEMKRCRRANVAENGNTEARNEENGDGAGIGAVAANEEDSEDDSRRKSRIKKISVAMKQCQKKIKKLEEAEVDFDDENNSHYLQLDRYKAKIVELHAKMCEYTNEHADAGRAYLRPKHLRVTQMPLIDQAINSFINSKITSNRKKAAKGKSFVDGLIFPDFVDILECVTKVNEENKLGLDKRTQRATGKLCRIILFNYFKKA